MSAGAFDMAVTYFPFLPSNQAPPQFSPTFDGAQYTVILKWSLARQAYFINIYTLGGVLIVALPLIESPVGNIIEAISWDFNTTKASLITLEPHGYVIGTLISLTVTGCTPDDYNGTYLMAVSDDVTLTYQIDTDPGDATVLGFVSFDISMTAGYFSSYLVFRNNQFEVSP